DGRLLLLPVHNEPSQVHAIEMWQTPYGHQPESRSDTLFTTIDPAQWVHVLSEAYQLKRLLDEPQANVATYEHLIHRSQQLIEHYPWLTEPELGDLHTTLQAILTTTDALVDEFNKLQRLRQQANQALSQAQKQQQLLATQLQNHVCWHALPPFIEHLQRLDQQRAQLTTLKTLPYIDWPQLETLEHNYQHHWEQFSQVTLAFIQKPIAFKPYYEALNEVMHTVEQLTQTQEIEGVEQRLQTMHQQLAQLSEWVNRFTINSASISTQILKTIAKVYAQLNRAQAELHNRHQALITQETQAEFAAYLKLLDQRIISAAHWADTPEKVDAQLLHLLSQVDDLANRFNASVDFSTIIAEKRTEVYQHFAAHKQALLTQRQQHTHQLIHTAAQLLTHIQRRAAELTTQEAQDSFFATDVGVVKLHELMNALQQWGEPVRAHDLQAQFKAVQQQARWHLQDHLATETGDSVFYLGQYPFSINTQALELTLVPYDAGMALHLTASDFFEPLPDPELTSYRAYWQRTWISESPQVYRGEYLAASLLFNAHILTDCKDFATLVDEYAQQQYQEGYDPGVHDHDAALILEQLLPIYKQAGLLRFSAQCRSIAQLFWALTSNRQQCQHWQQAAQSLRQLQMTFGGGDAAFAQRLRTELAQALQAFIIPYAFDFEQTIIENAAAYLLEELKQTPLNFTTSAQAMQLARDFWRDLDARGLYHQFEAQLRALPTTEQWQLSLAWLSGYTGQQPHSLLEASVLFLTGEQIERHVHSAATTIEIDGLLGQHPRIQNRSLCLQLDEFLERLHRFITVEVPGFRDYQNIRQQIIAREQQRLRLAELHPRALTTFVRNQLIDEVYLPVIGEQFAKQMSAFTSGLFLLAPPGYGKTTLMEYIAQRLGLIFVPIDCALIGNAITRLQPHLATDMLGRQELEKLNFAFALGHNVLLYLNGIEHSHPEFLHQFVSLAGPQRTIEGVWQTQARHHDMRGKRFILVMSAHSTDFNIPESLGQYLDSYALAELIQGQEALFALSYLENALPVHPQLTFLMTWTPAERVQLIRYAQGEAISRDAFKVPEATLEEYCAILAKLIELRTVLLNINRHYLSSANQDEQYRNEPAFKLSGSYRNMNQIAPRLTAIISTEEVHQLIVDHYAHQARTLTPGSEANLLKLKEIMGILTPEQAQRWAEIKSTFRRLQTLGDGDALTQLIRQISVLGEHLARIQQGLTQLPTPTDELPQLINALSELRFDVSIINKIPSGLEEVLTKNITIIDNTLLPIVREFERKSKLDLFIFERVKEISEILKELAASGEQKMRKHYKPLSLKRDE
ncbi:MAG: DNA repair ATPase, partial [Pseudomonadota bacterium]|nr:DNA repair ATPase [Pseudomonadota bacterium]